MPDWTQLRALLPAIGAGASGGPQLQAFMQGFQQTMQMLERQRQTQEGLAIDRDRTAAMVARDRAETERQAQQDRRENVGTLAELIPGIAGQVSAAPTMTEAPVVGSAGFASTPPLGVLAPTPEGVAPDQTVMAGLESMAQALGIDRGVAHALRPRVGPALSRAQAARLNARRKAYAEAAAKVEQKQKGVFDADPHFDPEVTVVHDDGTTETVKYSVAAREGDVPVYKAAPAKPPTSLEGALLNAKTPEERSRVLELIRQNASMRREPSGGAEPKWSVVTGYVSPDGLPVETDGRGNYRAARMPAGIMPKKDVGAEQEQMAKRRVVVDATHNTLDTLDELLTPDGTLTPKAASAVGASRALQTWRIPGTDAYDGNASIDRLRARLVTDLMAELKAQSRTGATGFGQLNREELKIMMNSAAKLDPNQSEASFAAELNRIRSRLELILKESPTAGAPAPTAPPPAWPANPYRR